MGPASLHDAVYHPRMARSAATTRLNADLDRRLFDQEALLKAGDSLQGEMDVGELCSLLLAMVHERVHAQHIAVLLHDEAAGRLSLEAARGLPDEVAGISLPADRGILWSLLRAGDPFSVVDLDGQPRFPDIFDGNGLRALLGRTWIPLAMPGRVVGVLSIGPDPLPESQHTFLRRLASRAALAIHTAVLYRSVAAAHRQLDRSIHHLSLLLDVSRALSAVANLNSLLRLILERAIDAVQAEKGSLMLLDEASSELVVRVVFGLPDKDVERRINDGEIACKRFKPGDGIAGKVFASGQPITVDNTEKSGDFTARESAFARSLLCVPMAVDGEAIGVINITNKKGERPFSPDDLGILRALADQAAVAIVRARLYEAAITDGLTGLCIRRFALHRLREEVKRARRYGTPLGMVMCDIDHFKRVNDTWGHPAGDAVIVAVAEVLRSGLRADVDVAGRYGGEEFLLLMPQTGAEGTRIAAERLRARIEERSIEAGTEKPLAVTMSFGVTELGADDTAETLLARADRALYASKEGGRNRVTVMEPDDPGGRPLAVELRAR